MRQRWTLNVKGFGKIRSASVEVAPLVLFVGENNSGKSYLVSLLWGLLALGRGLFPREVPNNDTYRRCAELLCPGETNGVSPALQQALLDWFNVLLRQRRNELVREVFSYDDLSIEHLSLSAYRRTRPLTIRWDEREHDDGARFSSGADYVRFPWTPHQASSEAGKYRMLQYLCWKLIMDDMSAPLFPATNFGAGRRVEGETLYLPAARSGFMLTYPSLTAELMNAWGGGAVSSTFTLPVVRFLQGLTENRRAAKARLADIANDLEADILDGKVLSEESAINSYRFQARSAKSPIPYHVASSLVGELTPIVLFLRSTIRYRSLIIEEPEAHLHPAMQKTLTCALSRIVTRGVPVWCTTHSDTVFQQLNNLIKLGRHPERNELMREYGYTKDDLLLADEVRAYEFVTGTDGKTEVRALPMTEDGFAVPTFNNALIQLSNETLAFMQDDPDDVL